MPSDAEVERLLLLDLLRVEDRAADVESESGGALRRFGDPA